MRGTCELCGGDESPVHKNRKTGKLACVKCQDRKRYKDPSKKEICTKCHKPKKVHTRDEAGGPICQPCHKQLNRAVCVKCDDGKLKIIVAFGLCSGCYSVLYRQRRKSSGKPMGKMGICVDCEGEEEKEIVGRNRCSLHYYRNVRRPREIARKAMKTKEEASDSDPA